MLKARAAESRRLFKPSGSKRISSRLRFRVSSIDIYLWKFNEFNDKVPKVPAKRGRGWTRQRLHDHVIVPKSYEPRDYSSVTLEELEVEWASSV